MRYIIGVKKLKNLPLGSNREKVRGVLIFQERKAEWWHASPELLLHEGGQVRGQSVLCCHNTKHRSHSVTPNSGCEMSWSLCKYTWHWYSHKFETRYSFCQFVHDRQPQVISKTKCLVPCQQTNKLSLRSFGWPWRHYFSWKYAFCSHYRQW